MTPPSPTANTTPTAWKWTGILSTLAILLSVPLYLSRQPPPVGVRVNQTDTFVGSDACRDCHRGEYDKWQNSHHRWAMAPATEDSVRGDFNDTRFEHTGIQSRFFRKGEKYFVHTQGPGGQMGDFEISYTFGWEPLQQYLIAFPGGRLQCLPIAWDTRENRWFHLYPQDPPPPEDWLYWTNQAQNWNGMCAECHSTDLKKNYDLTSDSFKTTWSEISVGCEACHGPGSGHVAWAQTPEMGRPDLPDAGLRVSTHDLSARQQIELCAPCHSRRMSLDDNIHRHADFLDYGIPQLLNENMYFADGQILDEVYVYGSFMQSKMYARDVRCSDCHDVHSIRRHKKGNDLCLQCHRAAVYDTPAHHYHKKAGEKGEPIRSATGQVLFQVGSGAQCEQCHMPGRIYMGNDYRPDHSFRLPRPDLTQTLGSPNACNRCHVDKTVQWSLEAMAKWYGTGGSQRHHYGSLLAAGRTGQPEALVGLLDLAQDRLYPTIVRATALSLIARYNRDSRSHNALQQALADEEALVRHTAIAHLESLSPPQRLRHLSPLLYDPVRAVRIEAARVLAAVTTSDMPADVGRQFKSVLAEYQQAMQRAADFPASRHNLGNLYVALGDTDRAIDHYQKAYDLDREFYPAKVNLAMLYNRQGRNDKAKQLLSEVVRNHPDQHDVKYSLGLLLAEMKEYGPAAEFMGQAAAALPQRTRINYNLSLLLQRLKRDKEAEQALLKALAVEPQQPDYLYAMALFYLQRGHLDAAQKTVERMLSLDSTRPMGHQLMATIKQLRARHKPTQ